MSVTSKAAAALATFEKAQVVQKKKKRLSSAGNALREIDENAANVVLNDDEQERELLRATKERELQAKKEQLLLVEREKEKEKERVAKHASASASASATNATAQNSSSKPSVAVNNALQQANERSRKAIDSGELTSLYNLCIKLATSNKINSKNTWGLHLIDYMDDVLQEKDRLEGKSGTAQAQAQAQAAASADEGFNFQKASCTLDASIMIYSSRVDSVHKDTYKVLGGLSRPDGMNEDEDEDGNQKEEQEYDEFGQPIPTQKKKHHSKAIKRGLKTLETRPAALNYTSMEEEFAIDPLFQQTTSKFDEGGARGLLVYHLHTYQAMNLALDSTNETNILTFKVNQNETTGAAAEDSSKARARQISQLRQNVDLNQAGLTSLFLSSFPTPTANANVSAVKELTTDMIKRQVLCPTLSDFQYTKYSLEREINSAAVYQFYQQQQQQQQQQKQVQGQKQQTAAQSKLPQLASAHLQMTDFPLLSPTSMEDESQYGGHAADDDDDDQGHFMDDYLVSDGSGASSAASGNGILSGVSAEVAELERAIEQEAKLQRLMHQPAQDHRAEEVDDFEDGADSLADDMLAEDDDDGLNTSVSSTTTSTSLATTGTTGTAGGGGLFDGLSLGVGQRSWAGASHWKYKPVDAATSGPSRSNAAAALEANAAAGKGKAKAKRGLGKKKKEPQALSFQLGVLASVANPASSSSSKTNNPFQAGTRSGVLLSSNQLTKLAIESPALLLPKDTQYTAKKLQTLFLKPQLLVKLARRPTATSAHNADAATSSLAFSYEVTSPLMHRHFQPTVSERGEAAADKDSSGENGAGDSHGLIPTGVQLAFEDDLPNLEELHDDPAGGAAAADSLDDHDDADAHPYPFGDGHADDDDDDEYMESAYGGSGHLMDALQMISEPEKLLQQQAFAAAQGGDGGGGAQPQPLGYARTAKRVDVKLLKQCLWRAMNFSGEDAATTAVQKAEEQPHKVVSFQHAINSLATTFPADALPSVSVSFCFICMLHLCNEKGLSLHVPGCNDPCQHPVYDTTDHVQCTCDSGLGSANRLLEDMEEETTAASTAKYTRAAQQQKQQKHNRDPIALMKVDPQHPGRGRLPADVGYFLGDFLIQPN